VPAELRTNDTFDPNTLGGILLVLRHRLAFRATKHDGTVLRSAAVAYPRRGTDTTRAGAAARDAERGWGRALEVLDARGNSADQRIYGMLGQSLRVISVDAGDCWNLSNALGQPMRSWDRLFCGQ
jgi:hypothetical protein